MVGQTFKPSLSCTTTVSEQQANGFLIVKHCSISWLLLFLFYFFIAFLMKSLFYSHCEL